MRLGGVGLLAIRGDGADEHQIVLQFGRERTIWQKWLARRDRRGRLPKSRFSALLQRHPLPAARIVHRYTFASKTLP
jgi:ligand-binding SRPBCC domain-containing protein